MTTLTIATIASILVVGGFVAAPEAYSTYGGWGDDDDDDCKHSNHGHYNDDDDDCGNDTPKDPCDCEKPDTLKFKFSTPSTEIDSEFRIEIYKKINDIGNEDKKLTSIADVTNSLDDYQIESSSYGKDKLNSNTVFAIYKIVENADDVLVSSIEIHTSCSKALYKGLTVMDNGYTLEVTDGLKDGNTSISESDPLTCGDEPEPEQIGKIVIRNALTVDNGGKAILEDFSYKVTDELGVDTDLVRDTLDPSIHVAEVPKGAYTLSQTIASTITEPYTEVLITGDKKCPATTNESFKIKKDKTVSCTIYNDDNGDGSGGPSGEPGVAFGFNGFEWNNNDLNSAGNQCPNMPSGGCVEKNGLVFVMVDPLLEKTDNTIVTWSMTAKELNTFTAHNCSIVGIFESITGVTTTDEQGNEIPAKGFGLFCSTIPFSGADWNINYAFIETVE